MTPELTDTLADATFTFGVLAFALGGLLSVVAFVRMLANGKNMVFWPLRMCLAALALVLLAYGLHQSNVPTEHADSSAVGAIKPEE